MTEAMIGYGTLFQTTDSLDDSPVVWRTVAEVGDITPPYEERDAIDTSHELAPNEWKTSLPGMKAAGEVSFKLNFIPGGETYQALRAELDDEVLYARRLVFPNGAILSFNAYLKRIETDAPTGGVIMASVTFQVSGEIGPFE
jgi:hypothetical protein